MLEAIYVLIPIVIQIIALILAIVISVAFYTLAERKVISYMQARIGPNRVGFKGILQPFADVFKLLGKEIIIPRVSNRYLFIIAPILSLVPALAAWAVIPFAPGIVTANINAGVLYLLAMTSLGIYGVLIAGWASNSKYAMFGAMRSAAQSISYEIGMAFTLVGVLIAAGSMNIQAIVEAQTGGFLSWYWLPLLPLFVCYWICGVAETNRAPFDVAEGESEIVAGFHVEYSGMGFGLFFIAEYASMILISFIAALMFLGGWLSPFEGVPVLNEMTAWVPATVWLLVKVAFFMYLYLWLRATFPRYRYDQIMHLGWKVIIPVTLFWIIVVAVMAKLNIGPWWG